MSSNETNTVFTHAARVTIPAAQAPRVWHAWETLSEWSAWDASLKGTEASSDGLSLGKGFAVLSKKAPMPIPVTVVALSEGTHFTTCSAGPMGLLAFGHTLAPSETAGTVTLEHTICAVPGDPSAFAQGIWPALKGDVEESVATLAAFVEGEAVA